MKESRSQKFKRKSEEQAAREAAKAARKARAERMNREDAAEGKASIHVQEKRSAKKRNKWKELFIGIVVTVLALAIGCVVYINDYYRASEAAVAIIEKPAEDIHLIVDEEGRMIFEPEEATTGIIFYPGGKVEAESYAPLLAALAREGILTVLVPMPAKLAVLDSDAAEGVVEHYDEIEEWYMAGHSLGGAMAAKYLAEQMDTDYFEGLILLAGYSTEDFSQSTMKVLSVYGDQDKVLNKEKYEKYFPNLPVDFTHEEIIEGGNHAQFGDYGPQDGDGKAKISAKEQRKQTVKAIKTFID